MWEMVEFMTPEAVTLRELTGWTIALSWAMLIASFVGANWMLLAVRFLKGV